ncbi:hypothetical protein NC651_020425 [Populus alba x Populus x berolinensis]|nr:hypothetical protein NC651_020425 [Populus alba x Populus x berolinensis]
MSTEMWDSLERILEVKYRGGSELVAEAGDQRRVICLPTKIQDGELEVEGWNRLNYPKPPSTLGEREGAPAMFISVKLSTFAFALLHYTTRLAKENLPVTHLASYL